MRHQDKLMKLAFSLERRVKSSLALEELVVDEDTQECFLDCET
jgi:hypothetical protein